MVQTERRPDIVVLDKTAAWRWRYIRGGGQKLEEVG